MPTLDLSHGGRLYYELKGAPSAAAVVVFLNGTAQTTVAWTEQARALNPRFRTLCYDARTQGRKSRLGDARPGLDLHSGDLAHLLDHLELERVHLVGISHGALLALAFSSRFKDRIQSLALINPGNPVGGRTRTALAAWRRILAAGDMQMLAWCMLPLVLGEKYLNAHQPVLQGMVKAIAARNRLPALEAHLAAMADYPPLASFVDAALPPTLFITGADDPLSDPQAIGRLAAAHGHRHRNLPGAGHSLPIEAPGRCAQLLESWLSAS